GRSRASSSCCCRRPTWCRERSRPTAGIANASPITPNDGACSCPTCSDGSTMPIDVVTGATGQLGRALMRALLRRGDGVRAVVQHGDPHASELLAEGAELAIADVRDASALHSAFMGARDVFHLAAIVDTTPHHSPRMWQVNVLGARLAAR